MASEFARMRFPNESAEYREARNALLDAEIALRRQTGAVADMRRALPPGVSRCVEDARPCRPLFPLGVPDRD